MKSTIPIITLADVYSVSSYLRMIKPFTDHPGYAGRHFVNLYACDE